MPDKLPTTPTSQPQFASVTEQSVWEQLKAPFRSKKGWIVLVLCLFLFLTGAVIPVGSIPFLRNLAYAMGYSPDEAKEMSLLRALLSWHDHSKQVTPDGIDPDEVSVFSSGAAAQNGVRVGGPENRLINIQAVNSSLARRGQRVDKVTGVHYVPGDEDGLQSSKVNITKSNVSAGTEANDTHPSEVFFGEDASAVTRDPKDGFNSSATLKKIANTNIAGAGEDDWFMKMVDKAKRKDVDVESLTKNLDMGTTLARLPDSMEVGKSRAYKDMYYAYFMGNAARRTNIIPLKKTLASAGFSGAEMPKSVFDSSGFSGVGIDKDAVVSDIENVKLRIENEKLCEDATKTSGARIDNTLKAARTNINNLPGSFPKNCDEVSGSSFTNSLGNIQEQCKLIVEDYGQLDTYCGIKIKQQGEACTTVKLTDAYDTYSSYCLDAAKECSSIEDPAAMDKCMAERKTGDQHVTDEYGKNIKDLVENSFEKGSGFFPEEDWANSNIFLP